MSCVEKNPLIREGTSLLNRVLDALSTDYAKPDERQASDIILFAKKYAAYLNYYNQLNTLDGDWEPLMKMDISVTLATLLKIDIRKCSDYKKLLYKKIKNSSDDANAKKQFKFLFDLMFSLVKITEEQYRLLPASFEYSFFIKNIIITKILGPLVNLKKLFDDFNTEILIDTTAGIDSEAPVAVNSSTNFSITDLGAEWAIPSPGFSITVPVLPTSKEKIVYIINHNLFNVQVESLLKAISFIVSRAGKLFEETLNNFPSHSPHYALFLTFIKLFRNAQDELNQYTRRHLDFYYKDVLQLKNKNPEPDTAHLVFELQKPFNQHLLKKDILFKGGKDITGKEINYSLTEDVVLNKASVAKVLALQMLKREKQVLYASPIAASEDGQGAKLNSPDKSWFTFGNSEKSQRAQIGFAIASNILFLNEGGRTVTVTLTFANSIAELIEEFPEPYDDYFTAKLTGKKDWHPIERLIVSCYKEGNQLIFSFTLNPDVPAIVAYSEKIHKENFETVLPLLKVFLNQSNANSFPYRLLNQERLKSVNITVDVVGVKDLMLSSDTGSIDASKPFKPFGDFPEKDASFYIGSKEIFQKKLTELGFEFGNDLPYKKNIEYLNEGSWSIIDNSINSDILSFKGNTFSPAAVDFSKNEPLTVTTLEGFVRLSLGSDEYSKKSYLDKVKEQINGTTVERTSSDPIKYALNIGEISAPSELILNRFSISYKASTNIFLDKIAEDANSHFFHLNPFGYNEVYFDSNQPSKTINLLPDIPNDGELIIGFADAEPESVINVLFQVSDGSSNPLKKMEVVDWYYLSLNNWVQFESSQIIDRTNNFTQSGVVTLTLSSNISNMNTVLQKGFHWIKAAVVQNPDAVCKMIHIQAQSALVQLVQDESKQIEFRQIIPSNTISKLLVSDAAIKTISQPFDSFGGRTREADEHFYVRVSERLRHKQRAITIWDYEHIILEQFQQIHKVRCINHAGFYSKTWEDGQGEDVFCENYPGHITIITIPDFKNKTGINPLRPYTPAGIRKNIKDYLQTVLSPFVKLHVENPQFEEVQLDFKVRFHENLDQSFHLQLLDKEIEKFLSPWVYDTNQGISFGGKIIKSVVLNFVEERPYVDHVTCFKMHHIIKRNGAQHTEEKRDVEEATGSTARSLLVSYFDEVNKKGHCIISPDNCTC